MSKSKHPTAETHDSASDPFETLLEELPIGIERIDTSGTILYSNPTHHRMLGYDPGELTGRKIYDLAADPEQRERLERHMALLVREQPEPERWIGTNRRKDGTTFEIQVDWRYERDEHGRLLGFVAAMTDITAQREAERQRDDTLSALQTNRRHLAALMESATDFVLYRLAAIPDKPYAGEVVLVSPSIREIMGVTDPRDFSTWFANIDPEDRDRVIEANRISAETGCAFDEVMRIYHPLKKESRWIRAISRPLLDDRGTPLFFNGLILDITAERRAQEERRQFELKLQQSQRLESLGTLAGGIAHDFNNLLVAILGSSDLAFQLLPDDSPAVPQLQKVVTAAQRAAELTNQLLAYSGRSVFNISATNMNSMLEEMASILRPAISKKAALEFDLAAGLPEILADTSQIRQVIMNLITNASEALGGKSGTIGLTTSEVVVDAALLQEYRLPSSFLGERYVRFQVSDSGCGMSAETLARIYDPFFTSKASGRGLGLATVRGIVHGHQGELHVTSAVGKGTTFTVFLPAASSTEPRRGKVVRSAGSTNHESRTVLIVDDEDVVRKAAANMLEVKGHEVLTAANGIEGLEVFQAHADEIDVVLLDMNMPEMNGQETFQRLREFRRDVPVVFSTGYSEQEVTYLLDAGIGVDFIQKPYRVAQLLEKLFHD